MSVSARFATLLGWTNLSEADEEQFASQKATVKTRFDLSRNVGGKVDT